ncbi:MAG: PEP-CTERM sorting domain-containing protein [Lentisphaerae bacterium]|nr:PEP-CTERM sorting domain-containing protein [Lentisphaerota bacterium]
MKKVTVMLLGGLLIASASHGAALSFFNTASGDFVTGDGSTGPAQAGWAVGAFVEAGGGAGYQYGLDTLYASTTLNDTGGGYMLYFYGGSDNSLAGTEITYVVFFNQGSVPGGGSFYYSEAVNNPFTLTGAPKDNVDFGGDTSWIFVPEPGSLALFGLGMVALVVGTKRRKK